jgi:endonuclease YncB( thermonuclease family)
MQVKDGDTVVISPIEGGQFFICRLYGIDAPKTPKNGKPGQPYGEESTKELKKLILGQEVTAEIRDRDKYNLEVSVIRKGVKDMNLEMISRGAARAYRKYLKPPYASEYIEAESAARGKGLGLWQQSNPEPPWEFRKK